jgi:hypothetical protein
LHFCWACEFLRFLNLKLQRQGRDHKTPKREHCFHPEGSTVRYGIFIIMRVTTNAITPDFIANSHGISNSERKSAQRKISFARVLSQVVGVVLSLDEFTEEEIRNCWWSYRDKQRSKVQSRGSISAIRRNGHAFVDTIQNSYKMAHQLSMHITADGTLLKNDDLHSSDLQSWTVVVAVLRHGFLHCIKVGARMMPVRLEPSYSSPSKRAFQQRRFPIFTLKAPVRVSYIRE